MKKIEKPYDQHVFVCCNKKEDGTGCGFKGGEELRAELKKQAIAKGLPRVRVNKAGCMDFCDNGIAVAVYPQGKFFLDVTLEDGKLENFI